MANKRLIDAEAPEADLKRQYNEVYGNARKTVNPDDFFIDRCEAYRASVVEAEQKGFFEYLKTRPTVHAVEVCYCKDCKHCITEKLLCVHPRNRVFNTGINVFSNHYCSHGERKEG